MRTVEQGGKTQNYTQKTSSDQWDRVVSDIRYQGSGIRDQGSEIHAALRAGKDVKPCAHQAFFGAAKPPVTSSDS
jgi:hypothetical protein